LFPPLTPRIQKGVSCDHLGLKGEVGSVWERGKCLRLEESTSAYLEYVHGIFYRIGDRRLPSGSCGSSLLSCGIGRSETPVLKLQTLVVQDCSQCVRYQLQRSQQALVRPALASCTILPKVILVDIYVRYHTTPTSSWIQRGQGEVGCSQRD
jgi:hypothetical protein